MDYVLLVYAIIFGLIGAYLLSLWQRVRSANRDLQNKK